MKRILCILSLSLIFTCSGCSLISGFAHGEEESTQVHAIDKTQLNQYGKDEKEVTEEKEETSQNNTSQEQKTQKKEYVDSLDELYEYVNDQLSQGQKEIHFKTKTLTLNDIEDINNYLDGYYGTVSNCSSKDSLISDSSEITLFCKVTDNYYVEQYILYGQDIATGESKARDLASACQDILQKMNDDLPSNCSDYDKELWIHDYLVNTVSYGFPNDNEASDSEAHESYGALVMHEAVCNGYAYAMKLLCDLNQIPCKVLTGTGNGENHAWNMVYIKGHWYHADVTWDDPTPDQKDRVVYTYLNIDDERISASHEWRKEQYPEADSMDYNYYMLNNLYCKDYDEFREKCISILEETGSNQFQLMVGDYDKGVYSDDQLDFLFDYTDYRKMSYQTVGEIPYMTLYITFE